jgi:hypothetical protein
MVEAPGIYRNELDVDGNFTTVENVWIRSSGLTPQANFLWVYLLSHKIGYELRDGQILRETGFGRKGLRAARNELVEKGWLVLERMKNPDGSLGTYAYHLQTTRDPQGTVDAGTVAQGTVPEGSDLRRLLTKEKTNNLEKTNLLDAQFNQFWETYPRKVGKGKARQAFEKALEKTDIDTILAGVQAYVHHEGYNDMEFIAHPTSWLNGERWDDEYETPMRKETPTPGKREWVREMHMMGEHWACEPGEFEEGCGQ